MQKKGPTHRITSTETARICQMFKATSRTRSTLENTQSLSLAKLEVLYERKLKGICLLHGGMSWWGFYQSAPRKHFTSLWVSGIVGYGEPPLFCDALWHLLLFISLNLIWLPAKDTFATRFGVGWVRSNQFVKGEFHEPVKLCKFLQVKVLWTFIGCFIAKRL